MLTVNKAKARVDRCRAEYIKACQTLCEAVLRVETRENELLRKAQEKLEEKIQQTAQRINDIKDDKVQLASAIVHDEARAGLGCQRQRTTPNLQLLKAAS